MRKTKSKDIKPTLINLDEELGKLGVTTDIEGASTFPVTENEYIESVEKIALQHCKGLASSNAFADGVRKINVTDGSVLEESVIKMAEKNAYDRDAWDKTPIDPKASIKYFNNWISAQYGVTIRRDDLRKIVSNKGVSVEDFATIILNTLTNGEDKDAYVDIVELLYKADMANFSNIALSGKAPKTMKGVVYALRKMFNHLKATNNDLTSHDFASSTPIADIRIAISDEVMNLIDVTEFAHIFNLSKEELMGKLVIFNLSVLKEYGLTDEQINAMQYRIFAYDINALIEAERLRDITKDESGKGRFVNFYLTVDKLHAHNGLMKGCYLNVQKACENALEEIVESNESVKVTYDMVNVSGKEISSVEKYDKYGNTFTCEEGYVLDDATITITMGNTVLTNVATISEDKKSVVVAIASVTDALTITIKPFKE